MSNGCSDPNSGIIPNAPLKCIPEANPEIWIIRKYRKPAFARFGSIQSEGTDTSSTRNPVGRPPDKRVQ